MPVIALYTLVDCCALAFVCYRCSEYVSFVSSVTPRIFGCVSVFRVLLLIFNCSFLEYSAGSGVKRVVCVLFLFSISFFCFVHCTMLLRYVWICSCAML